MSLNAKKVKSTGGSGTRQEGMEAGTYSCRVVQILDLGLQPQRPYQGQEKAPAHSLSITYEFVDEFCKDKDGNDDETKPRWLSEDMPLHNLEADLAKSTKRYNAIDPQGAHEGDFTQIVGMGCMVTITAKPNKKDGISNYVSTVSAMRAKDLAKIPELVNPAKVFLMDDPDLEVLGSLPEWLQDKMKSNLEFAGSPLEKALGGSSKPATKDEPVVEEDDAKEDDSADEGW